MRRMGLARSELALLVASLLIVELLAAALPLRINTTMQQHHAAKTTTSLTTPTFPRARHEQNRKPILALIIDALKNNHTLTPIELKEAAKLTVIEEAEKKKKEITNRRRTKASSNRLFPDFESGSDYYYALSNSNSNNYDNANNYEYYEKNSHMSNVNLVNPMSTSYDGAVVFGNGTDSSVFDNDYDLTAGNNSFSAATIYGQLSMPIVYIISMLVLYGIIIFIVFISALYSHRKRIGYNYYDDDIDDDDYDDDDDEDDGNKNDDYYDKVEHMIKTKQKQLDEEAEEYDGEAGVDEEDGCLVMRKNRRHRKRKSHGGCRYNSLVCSRRTDKRHGGGSAGSANRARRMRRPEVKKLLDKPFRKDYCISNGNIIDSEILIYEPGMELLMDYC